MLRDEYKAVFHAVRELRLTDDTTLNQYIHNGYRALIMPINKAITQAENKQEKSGQLNIAMNYYNKSALLYDLDEPSFFEEALDAALKSVQILKELVEIGQIGRASCRERV